MKTGDKVNVICPKCGARTKTMIKPGSTILVNFPLYCNSCRRETIITYKPERLRQSE